jgi:hypothetical protein
MPGDVFLGTLDRICIEQRLGAIAFGPDSSAVKRLPHPCFQPTHNRFDGAAVVKHYPM